jgi:hypothetical protein
VPYVVGIQLLSLFKLSAVVECAPMVVASTAPKQPDVKSAPVAAAAATTNQTTPSNKSFYGSTGSAQPTARSNSKVYNGGAPTGFIEPPTNIHPIASLTPYQNRYSPLCYQHRM